MQRYELAQEGYPNDLPSDRSVRRRSVTGFGFYLYLLTDGILFATLFAAFAVLHRSIADGPGGHDLFSLRNAFIETACLLTSSLTCGIAMLASDRRDVATTLGALALTFVLGVAFLSLELTEFAHMLSVGAGPDRSAFLSAFFAVTGGFGMVWHIYWLGAGSLIAAVACWIYLSWNEDDEMTLPAGEVAEAERLMRHLTVRHA